MLLRTKILLTLIEKCAPLFFSPTAVTIAYFVDPQEKTAGNPHKN
jgi:hypothetical protein